MKEKVTCEICGKEFKDKAGLSGHKQFKHSRQSEPQEDVKMTALVKRQAQPIEELARELVLPEVANGTRAVFDAGVQYGIKSVLVGIRAAQELSAMGVQQAVPIIRMAQEMRQSEGQAAQVIAGELAQAMSSGNHEILSALHGLNVSSPAAGPTNPMQRMVTMLQTIPQMMSAFQGLTGLFGMKTPAAGQPGQDQGQPEQGSTQPEQGSVQPIQPQIDGAGSPQQATDKDIEEAFDD